MKRLLIVCATLALFVIGCDSMVDPETNTERLTTSNSSTDSGYSAILLSDESSRALAISNSGHVVGTIKGSDGFDYAVRWRVDASGVIEGPIALGELPNVQFQEPWSVNNHGVVVGRASSHAAFVFESEIQLLPRAPQFNALNGAYHPLHINDQGAVVGQVQYAVYEDGVHVRHDVRGLLWQAPYDNPPVVLPPLEGHIRSRAAHVDERGMIAGVSYTNSSDYTIVLWEVSDGIASAPVVVSDSPPVWFTTRNDIDDILGFAEVFRNGAWQVLQPLPRHHNVRSFNMGNPDGQGAVRIVGLSIEDGATAGTPVTWTLSSGGAAGEAVQLDAPGRNFSGNGSARAVNDAGLITGYTFRRTGQHRATLWLPDGDSGGDPSPPSGDGPTASFAYSCGNSPTCQFTDTSTGHIAEWRWTSTSGHSSVERHPTFTFGGAGSHTVTLEVTDGQSSDEASAAINCKDHPRHGLRCS